LPQCLGQSDQGDNIAGVALFDDVSLGQVGQHLRYIRLTQAG
jgi:hypothetical protein